jgi:hypothetical protein
VEFDGIAISLSRHPHDGLHDGAEFTVSWGTLPLVADCSTCQYAHKATVHLGNAYAGDSKDEANAEFDELERKLLAGELG